MMRLCPRSTWKSLAALIRVAGVTFVITSTASLILRAQETPITADAAAYVDSVLADSPAAYWRFDGDKDQQLVSSANSPGSTPQQKGRLSGDVRVDNQGPAAPRFPLFGASNQAVTIQNGGSYIRVADPGASSVLDFDIGDTITIEAWVNPTDVGAGQQVYIVGKGRTQNPGVAANNQNYAIRLHGVDGAARLSFLFRSAASPGTEQAWHRWNSDARRNP